MKAFVISQSWMHVGDYNQSVYAVFLVPEEISTLDLEEEYTKTATHPNAPDFTKWLRDRNYLSIPVTLETVF